MARAKSERSRSKPTAIDELTQSIEQLQALLPKVEDLGRDGFPYLESTRARTELQIRECIKRAFGEKSPEFQSNRQLKLAIGPNGEQNQTVILVKNLIATLEDKKLELQGIKPSASEDSQADSTPTAQPKMTLVPPTAPPAQVTEPSLPSVTPPPIISPAPAATPVNTGKVPSASSTLPAPAPPSPPPSLQHRETAQAAVAMPKPQSISPEQISSLFRPRETGSVTPLVIQTQQPANVSPPAGSPSKFSTTQEVPIPLAPVQAQPASPPSTVRPIVSPPKFSTTQEVPVLPPPVQQHPLPSVSASAARDSSLHAANSLDLCRRLCHRFHAIARQLRLRGEYRATVAIEDEIDVQDLLHALLRVQFDDIGTDEWTPRYSNDAPRTTFLLDHDGLAVVVKKTRAGLSAKDLAEQLRLDIERYRTRERCTALFCFVYDPEGRIGNPRGLEQDLATTSEHFTVNVLVAPK
jgi:REase_DpnII-MboI